MTKSVELIQKDYPDHPKVEFTDGNQNFYYFGCVCPFCKSDIEIEYTDDINKDTTMLATCSHLKTIPYPVEFGSAKLVATFDIIVWKEKLIDYIERERENAELSWEEFITKLKSIVERHEKGRFRTVIDKNQAIQSVIDLGNYVRNAAIDAINVRALKELLKEPD